MAGQFEAQWEEYARRVMLPSRPGRVQVQETRRAFYAGAAAFLSAILGGLTGDKEPTAEDLAALGALKAELDAFARDVEEGRA
jgi:hypothetical protein